MAETPALSSSHDRAFFAFPLVVPALLEAGIALLMILVDCPVILLFGGFRFSFRLESTLLESHEDTGSVLMSVAVCAAELTSVKTSFIFLSSSLRSTSNSPFGFSDVSRANAAICLSVEPEVSSGSPASACPRASRTPTEPLTPAESVGNDWH